MRKELKSQIIDQLSALIQERPNFYITDIEGLNAEQTSALRRACFGKDIKLLVVKNTLLSKVLEKGGDEMKSLCSTLKGSTALMFTETPNAPAKLIKEQAEKTGKPVLKAAYVQECAYVAHRILRPCATSSPAKNSSAISLQYSSLLSRTLSAVCRPTLAVASQVL